MLVATAPRNQGFLHTVSSFYKRHDNAILIALMIIGITAAVLVKGNLSDFEQMTAGYSVGGALALGTCLYLNHKTGNQHLKLTLIVTSLLIVAGGLAAYTDINVWGKVGIGAAALLSVPLGYYVVTRKQKHFPVNDAPPVAAAPELFPYPKEAEGSEICAPPVAAAPVSNEPVRFKCTVFHSLDYHKLSSLPQEAQSSEICIVQNAPDELNFNSYQRMTFRDGSNGEKCTAIGWNDRTFTRIEDGYFLTHRRANYPYLRLQHKISKTTILLTSALLPSRQDDEIAGYEEAEDKIVNAADADLKILAGNFHRVYRHVRQDCRINNVCLNMRMMSSIKNLNAEYQYICLDGRPDRGTCVTFTIPPQRQ